MASDQTVSPAPPPALKSDVGLADAWRRLSRVATFVAIITAPAIFVWLHQVVDWSVGWSILATVLIIAGFRGVADVLIRKWIPWPTLFGVDDPRANEEDVINRRRAWFWRFWLRVVVLFVLVVTIVYLVQRAQGDEGVTWTGTIGSIFHGLGSVLSNSQLWIQVVFVFFLFLANILLFMGPLLIMGISQIRAYEPGDANWGVRLDDVRGQAEAKEEVRRVVSLWQSGEAFERAGGKRERGMIMLGAPGTGKTMLSKAIATGFNCPFVSIPGSGFAQAFIGIDAIVVRYLAWKAKRLARKWGGQCIVFIDEIDAVGMRRQALGGAHGHWSPAAGEPPSIHDLLFFGPMGALNPSCDMILETRAWREKLFAARAPGYAGPSGLVARLGGIMNQVFPGMMGGMGQLALNQLLVVMDGIGDPPFLRRFWTNRTNTLLDALYVVPRRVGRVRLRLPRPRPRKEQIFFIGACNVPLEVLDPALTRPGRMGRHIWFQTPTKQDRLDIFDLYLGKVSHDPELNQEKRREELARITNGYSPAMIEQVCSMGLTIAHNDGRLEFTREDIVEAMTTVESGTAINIEYTPEETRAVAIHEAGHAVAAHVFMKRTESTRLSIRKRGASLGHHQAREKEERFTSWRSEEVAELVWGLGAMAAERVFYGENSSGVGGDVFSVTTAAAWMVGAWAMAPERVELNGAAEAVGDEDETRGRITKRFEEIGLQIMRRTGGGGPFEQDPIQGVLSDPEKRKMVAQLLGQAYVRAHNLVEANKPAVEHIAGILVARRELHGDEVVKLLDEANLKVPEVDLTKESAWPAL
jgi:cell division protease FtsH